jgi:EKC/KEOPS complex subunit CGI121/TPRKB
VIKVVTSLDITFESVTNHLADAIKATPVHFDDDTIQRMSDIARISKVYKLSPSSAPKNWKASQQLVNGDSRSGWPNESRDAEVQILGAMALRGAA